MIDHDRLFKELLTTFFAEFLELFLPEVAAYVDRRSLTFLDKEVFTDVTAGTKQEADLVVKARFRGQASFFPLHLEHSAQPRLLPPRRMFGYFAPRHAKHGLPVYPIALFSQGVMEPAPDEYRVAFPDLEVLRFRYRVIQLRRWRWRDFVRTPNPVASTLMATMGMAPTERPRVKLECLRLLVTLRQDPARLRLIGGFVDTYLRLTAAEELRFQRETASVLKRTEQQGVIELMTSWEEKGLARGRAEGLALGRNEGIVLGRNEGLALGRDQGVREVVRRLLQRRWGALSPSVERRLRELACEQVQELADRLLDFRSLAELKKWLATH